jgi:hypothetical protein
MRAIHGQDGAHRVPGNDALGPASFDEEAGAAEENSGEKLAGKNSSASASTE